MLVNKRTALKVLTISVLVVASVIYIKDYRDRAHIRALLHPIEQTLGISHPPVLSRHFFHQKSFEIYYDADEPSLLGGHLESILVRRLNNVDAHEIKATIRSPKGVITLVYRGNITPDSDNQKRLKLTDGVMNIQLDRENGDANDIIANITMDIKPIGKDHYRFLLSQLIIQTNEHQGHVFAEQDDDLIYGELALNPLRVTHFSMGLKELYQRTNVDLLGDEVFKLSLTHLPIKSVLALPLLDKDISLYQHVA
ncbi:MAG: hypothetical protein ACON5A_05165 [Candidatus Comchoanobacterales bacterium]